MQITRQADYATRAVLCLAQAQPGTRLSTARIAEQTAAPPAFLAKIIAQLASAGVVQAVRGARGGVSLARPAATISLLEVVEAIDGALELNACAIDPTKCGLSATCPLQPEWSAANHDLRRRLATVTFEDLAANSPA
jgi:Rrf2 family protein